MVSCGFFFSSALGQSIIIFTLVPSLCRSHANEVKDVGSGSAASSSGTRRVQARAHHTPSSVPLASKRQLVQIDRPSAGVYANCLRIRRYVNRGDRRASMLDLMPPLTNIHFSLASIEPTGQVQPDGPSPQTRCIRAMSAVLPIAYKPWAWQA